VNALRSVAPNEAELGSSCGGRFRPQSPTVGSSGRGNRRRSGRRHTWKTVTSGDGTRIAFERLGRGPALVIVGASLADHRFYAPLANELAKHLKV
jgi:hypothetical protein